MLNETELPVWHRLEQIEGYKEDDIKSSGYTVHTLEAATWSFLTTESYEEAVIRAANLGDDADTTAAVFGQLAGAFYGAEAIPESWMERLAMREFITEMADSLGSFSESQ